jgi:uncharacterized protein (TIGR02996 family)
MSSAEAFLRAILDDPDDDVVRLVFADWLDEHDDPRGEFIRAQVQAAALPDGDPRRAELEARANELLRRHHDQWDQPLLDAAGYDPRAGGLLGMLGTIARLFRAPWPKPPLYLRDYRRGFVEVIHIDMGKFVERAEALFEAAPIREVYFELVSARLTDLAALPQLARVRGLHFIHTQLREDALVELFASQHLTGLRTLDMPGNVLSEHALRLLGVATCARRLTALNLCSCDVSERGALALAEAPALAALAELDLSFNSIGDAGVAALAASPHLLNLTALFLAGTEVGGDGALALAKSPYLGKLKELNLGEAVVGRDAMEALRRRFPDARLKF